MRKSVCKTQKRDAERGLIAILRKAHAGERAAALAYRGHARIARNPDDRRMIAQIEADEWLHRRELRRMLRDFGARPSVLREIVMLVIGHTVAIGCFVCGMTIATYFAAVLESSNVDEYEQAADFAKEISRHELEAELRQMVRTEADHERVLREMIGIAAPAAMPAAKRDPATRI